MVGMLLFLGVGVALYVSCSVRHALKHIEHNDVFRIGHK